jgi:Ca2+-binding RTX toxin-like protein
MRCRTGTTERGRSRVVAFGLVTILASVVFQSPALAGSRTVKCSYDEFKQAATITVGAGGTATIVRSMSGSIDVNGNPCGAARIDNTIQVTVIASAKGRQVVKIALAGGPFFNPVADTRIRFTVNLGLLWDKLVVLGTNDADNITYGKSGINLARSEPPPADISFENLERVVVRAGGGKDVVTANGGDGTGAPPSLLPGRTTFFGGRGADLLIGTNRSPSKSKVGDDILCPSPPTICQGTATGETLQGGSGVDRIFGDDGDDKLYGGPKRDHLHGDNGDDKCWLGLGGASHSSCKVQHR